MFTEAETIACRRLLELALEEDVGSAGDLTSLALIPADQQGAAVFVARASGVLAGMPAVAMTLAAVDPRLQLQVLKEDGSHVAPGNHLALVSGPMRGILTAERTALNFLQHLSGIASHTRRHVDLVSDLPVKLLDTRKTIPGWRLLAKYAVRCGGGNNHRMGLHDGILIKDNHLKAMGGELPEIAQAVEKARDLVDHTMSVEVEVDTLEQLEHALRCKPDIILLDNMGPDQLREAVRRRNHVDPRIQLEASGGINLSTLRIIAETGVDRISIGALTHSATALDIALDYQTEVVSSPASS